MILKKINYKILIFVSFFLIASCEVLEEEPLIQASTENFYQTETDALAALTSSYARLKSGIGYYKQQFLPTLFASSDQGLSTYLYNEFKRGVVTSTNQSLNNLWKELYLGIRDANNVIVNVPNIDMDEDLKNRIIGEAKFLRALHYFNLVRCFGEVPLRLEPVEADNDEGLPVSSIVEIYDAIISDLDYASIHCWGRNEARGNM